MPVGVSAAFNVYLSEKDKKRPHNSLTQYSWTGHKEQQLKVACSSLCCLSDSHFLGQERGGIMKVVLDW